MSEPAPETPTERFERDHGEQPVERQEEDYGDQPDERQSREYVDEDAAGTDKGKSAEDHQAPSFE